MWFHRAFWLGLVRGIAEFLPISSTGHTRLFQEILSEEAYRVSFLYGFTSLAILLASLIFFRKELKEIFKKKKTILNVLVSGLPVALLAVFLQKSIASSELLSGFWIIAAAFAITGVILIKFNKLPSMKKVKSYEDLKITDALCIGIVNLFALVPGFSRFGLSFISSKIVGLDTKSSLRYSYLASTPSLVAISIASFTNPNALNFLSTDFGQCSLAFGMAFIAALYVLAVTKMYFAKKNDTKVLGWYLVFATLIICAFELLKQ